MSEDKEPVDFEAFFATIELDEQTLNSASDKTIVPEDTQTFQAPHSHIETLPQLRVKSADQSSELDTPDLEMQGKLGEGGMGVVYLARQRALERMVAVKSSHSANQRAAQSLFQEAYVTGMLEHPNIIPVYNLGRNEEGAPLIVMKRVEGTCWLDLLKDPSIAPIGEKVDLAWHLDLLTKVCDAIRFAHARGVIHRDIKPENVMIGSFGEAYLLDWGISVGLVDEHPTIQHRSKSVGIAGTPAYMAPEMTMDTGADVDERSDVYLLGSTLHQLITGELRHQGSTVTEVLFNVIKSEPYTYSASIPNELAGIANKATARDPEDRYQSVDQFQKALEDYLEHRASNEIADEAALRLVELGSLLKEEDIDDKQHLRLHNVFGECRFGLRQAIKLWPANTAAKENLQACLELMVRYYIDHENDVAAAATLSEVDNPSPMLTEEVRNLAAVRSARLEEVESLKRIRDAADPTTGSRARSILVLALGAIWSIDTAYGGWLRLTNEMTEAEWMTRYLTSIRVFILAAVLILVFRKSLFANRTSSRITSTLLFTFVVLIALRIFAYSFGVNVALASSAEVFIYAMATVAGGMLSNLRIAFVGVGTFIPTAFLGLVYPDYRLFFLSGALFIVFAAVAWIWRNDEWN